MRRVLMAGVATIILSAVAQTKEEQIREATDLELQKAINQLETNAPTPEIGEAAARLHKAYRALEAEKEAYARSSAKAHNAAELAYETSEEFTIADMAVQKSTEIQAAETAEFAKEAYGQAFAFAKDYEAQRLVLEKEADNFVTAVRNTPLKESYKQAAFQCLDDYNICNRGENTKLACFSILVVCLAKGIIPGTG